MQFLEERENIGSSDEINTETEWVTPKSSYVPQRPQRPELPQRPQLTPTSSRLPSIFDIFLNTRFLDFDKDSDEDETSLIGDDKSTGVVRSVYKKSVTCIQGKCEVVTCINGKCEKSEGNFDV